MRRLSCFAVVGGALGLLYVGDARAQLSCPTTCTASGATDSLGVTNTGTAHGGSFSAADGCKAGVYGTNTGTTCGEFGAGYGVEGYANIGVNGLASTTGGIGVWAQSYTGGGATGDALKVDAYQTAVGVYASSASNDAVYGSSTSSNGVHGESAIAGASGVYAHNSSSGAGYGVAGRTNSNGTAVYGDNTCTGSGCTGYSGYFTGRVAVIGTLSKGAGSFKIDHPLDPENKYLYHSFVESPDMKNIYDGVVRLDSRGEATVTMPAWFDALNDTFRYQLTCVGGFAPVYVAEEMQGNRFKISGGMAGMKVSWQVTGVRRDAFANANRIPVEELKPVGERGKYLHPAAFHKPASMGISVPAPETMK